MSELAQDMIQETPIETHEGLPTGHAVEPAPTEPAAAPATPEVEILTIGTELTDEDRNRIYSRLGRPEAPDKYDLTDIVPENYNHSVVEEFKQKAYENGMSNEGVRKMAEWYKDIELKQAEAMQKAKMAQADQHILHLKKEFGTRFDEEVNNARKALDAYTDKDFRKYMDETGLGNHPALVKAFAKIGRELSEDRLVQSETATKLAQDEHLRRAEILRLRADQTFMERYRRGDREAVARLNRLYE